VSVDPIQDYLDRVADQSHFPTAAEVEERLRRLHARRPDRTALDVIGRSRSGRPLSRLVVGAGVVSPGRHAVVTGLPHPNEPTGTLGALALAELLADDASLLGELGLTWHVVPCADPDGAVLNEGWYAGPFTRRHYAEHIYRPPFPEQYEWTFQLAGLDPPGLPPIPESAAVAALLDELRPVLLITMHNGEAGGLYAYVTRDVVGMREAVQETAQAAGLPLYRGIAEGEAPVLGPGLFEMPDAMGELVSSTDYARSWGALGVVIEPPMWVDASSSDDSQGLRTLREVRDEATAARGDLVALLGRWLDRTGAYVDLDTARGRAACEQRRYVEHLAASPAYDAGDLDRRCSVAYETSMAEDVLLERLRAAGHLVALLREVAEQGSLPAPLAAVYDEASASLAAWASEQPEPEFVGVGAAVRAHVGLALSAARLLGG
jgi:hypothetical protein